jgi:hypothetical protein
MKQTPELLEFPITEWLLRLNLIKYIPKFAQKEILFVSDIKKWLKDNQLHDELFVFRKDE